MQIQSLAAKGFRSLNNVGIGSLGPINIIYGENNAGKSNILSALEIIFKVEKVEELESPVAGFLRSELNDFMDNFNIKNDRVVSPSIEMNVRLGISDKDLDRLPKFSDFIKAKDIYEDGHEQRLEITIEIKPSGKYKGARITKKVLINGDVMYDVQKNELERFFPGFSKVDPDVVIRQNPAEEILAYLINSFTLINSGRFLQRESVTSEKILKPIPQQFKNWILNLSQQRGRDFDIYRKIQNWFNEEPFNYGSLRPVVEDGIVGLIIEDDYQRELPIERLGTGLQQILMLLSNISSSTSRLIGIEEIELNLSPSLQYKTLTMLREMLSSPKNTLIDQFIITSHSMHLSKREDAVLYAVSMNEDHCTEIQRGPAAIKKLKEHFGYGIFKINNVVKIK